MRAIINIRGTRCQRLGLSLHEYMGTTTPANGEKYIGKFDRAVWDPNKHDTGVSRPENRNRSEPRKSTSEWRAGAHRRVGVGRLNCRISFSAGTRVCTTCVSRFHPPTAFRPNRTHICRSMRADHSEGWSSIISLFRDQ